jgi:hypothetical protein
VTSSTRSLLASLLTFASGLGSADALLAHHAREAFGPNQRMGAAIARGDGCVVAVGDSRIAAGVDPDALASELESRAAHACVAPLGIPGVVDIQGQALVLRTYLLASRAPRVVVLGAGALLPTEAIDPSEMAGNAALDLAWSRAADARDFFPGFTPRDLDRALRFSVERASALQTYGWLVWDQVQARRSDLLGDLDRRPANRFGRFEDMDALAGAFADRAERALERWDEHWQEGPWFEAIRALVHARRASLVVVHVPVRASYRRRVNDTARWKSYEAWLREDLAGHGDRYVDLSSCLDDALLDDGVHANAEGARVFSRALGRAIAPTFSGAR